MVLFSIKTLSYYVQLHLRAKNGGMRYASQPLISFLHQSGLLKCVNSVIDIHYTDLT